MIPLTAGFPPRPRALHGRKAELSALERLVRAAHPTTLALVGTGGSGKSTLAAALGHRVRDAFPGGVHWFRIGSFSASTITTLLALRFGLRRDRPLPAVRRALREGGPSFIVLDNHESDDETASFLDALRAARVTWVITARRCLLGGVRIHPVTAPLSATGAPAFPGVPRLTPLLRHHPVALAIAEGLVSTGDASEAELSAFLVGGGVSRVTVIADEDDLPEVRLMVDWVWRRLSAGERRLVGVLACMGGDHMDAASLGTLSGAGARAATTLAFLRERRFVEEPFAGRYSLHATVRRAVRPRVTVDSSRYFAHYVALLEADPLRLELEQTHLFAAMDHAQAHGDLADRVRLEALLRRLGL